jgi:hypothetical protein
MRSCLALRCRRSQLAHVAPEYEGLHHRAAVARPGFTSVSARVYAKIEQLSHFGKCGLRARH